MMLQTKSVQTPDLQHGHPSGNTPEGLHGHPSQGMSDQLHQLHGHPSENTPEGLHGHPPQGTSEHSASEGTLGHPLQIAPKSGQQAQSCIEHPHQAEPRVYQDITQTIGNTPLVRLPRWQKAFNIKGEILAKLEYFNPAGSVKDRPAHAMITALMASQEFTAQTEIVEASSGNNGVACAWLCAIYNIPLTVVIPEHMSIERRQLMRHYGARVITTPKALGTKGAIDKAKSLRHERPHAVMLDQFANPQNPACHAKTTAMELWRDTAGDIDTLVAGIGTGGTITGIARMLKSYNPKIQIIGVEPASCPILTEGRSGVHNIQGLSSGHVPDILQRDLLDEVLTVSDEAAIEHARMLARIEGITVGISSGAAISAASRVAARRANSSRTTVTLLADGAERYFSTALFEPECR